MTWEVSLRCWGTVGGFRGLTRLVGEGRVEGTRRRGASEEGIGRRKEEKGGYVVDGLRYRV